MKFNPQTQFFSSAFIAAIAALALVFTTVSGSAQVVKRGVQGGLLGAGIGALVGGGKGAAKGAAVGAAIGTVVGVGEKKSHGQYERHPAPPPQHGTAYPAPPPRHHAAYPPAHGNLVYSIQHSLTKLGYSPGPVDGQYGRRTADAIKAYEYNNQLLVTGQPSEALHQHMLQNGG